MYQFIAQKGGFFAKCFVSSMTSMFKQYSRYPKVKRVEKFSPFSDQIGSIKQTIARIYNVVDCLGNLLELHVGHSI